MDEPTITGTDVLRQTVKARNKSPHAISVIAREIDGIGAGTLEDFAAGNADLPVEALQAVGQQGGAKAFVRGLLSGPIRTRAQGLAEMDARTAAGDAGKAASEAEARGLVVGRLFVIDRRCGARRAALIRSAVADTAARAACVLSRMYGGPQVAHLPKQGSVS